MSTNTYLDILDEALAPVVAFVPGAKTTQPGTPLSIAPYEIVFDDLQLFFGAALALTVLRFLFIFGLRPFAKTILGIKKHRKAQKFAETAWFYVYYTIAFAFAVAFIVLDERESWVFDRLSWWQYWPVAPLSLKLKLFYIFETSFYIHALLVVMIEEKRSDFMEMLIHHIVTILLTGISSFSNHHRVGFAILVLHDVSDVLLYGGKLIVYCKLKTLADVVLGCFALCFGVSRLGIFPVTIYSVVWERRAIWERLGHDPNDFIVNLLGVLLSILLCLHIFWYMLIIRMVYRAITKKEVEKDIRSDSDDD